MNEHHKSAAPLCQRLGGADVRVFVRATSSGQLRNIIHLKDRVKVHQGDLADRTAVDRAITVTRTVYTQQARQGSGAIR